MTAQCQISLPIGYQLAGWLPDETLFSWCSRYHYSAVNGLASATCMQLFGHRTAGSAHDFPSRVDEFVRRTDSQLGDAENLIGSHTVLPYYLPFRDGQVKQESMLSMRGPNIGSLKYRLGMLSSGLPADHPLKACPDCMAENQKSFGVAYWHRMHQFPTVMVCPTHGTPLLVSPMKVQHIARFQWILPHNAGLSSIVNTATSARPQLAQLRALFSLAQMAVLLADAEPATFADAQRLSKVFRTRFIEQGLASSDGRIFWSLLLSKIGEYVRVFDSVSGMGRRLAAGCRTQSPITRLLGARALMHPSKYMVWIACFFNNWADFLGAYHSVNPQSLPEVDPPQTTPTAPSGDARREQAIELINRGKDSLSAIAHMVGVDFSTVAAWAAKEGIAPPRRPKKLHPTVLGGVIEGLESGASKEDLARKHHVSIVTITRVLRTEPGLSRLWHHVLGERRRREARAKWLELLTGTTGLPIKTVRKMDSATFAWLYRNDREWLCASNLQYATAVQPNNHAQSRMHRKDAELAQSVRMLALDLHRTRFGARIDFSELTTALPELRTCIRQLARWPQTASVIEQVLSQPPPRLESGNPMF